MPSVASPLGTTQPYIPAVPSLQIGRYAGLRMHFSTLDDLNAAIQDELANIDISSGIWPDGQSFSVGTESPEYGVFRTWVIADAHARRMYLSSGRILTLQTDANTLHKVVATPDNSLGVDGDYAAFWDDNRLFFKDVGAWTYIGPINLAVSQDLVVTLESNVQNATFNRGVYSDWRATIRVPGLDADWSMYSGQVTYRRSGVYLITLQCEALPDQSGLGYWPDSAGGAPLQTFFGCVVDGVESQHTRTGGQNPPNSEQVARWSDEFIVEVQDLNLFSSVGLFAKAYTLETTPVVFNVKVRVSRLGDAPPPPA